MAIRTIRKIAPLSLGKVLTVLYGLVGCIVIPFAWLGFFMGDASAMGVLFVPVLYATFGFVGGIVGAALFNVASGWMGGVQVELDE